MINANSRNKLIVIMVLLFTVAMYVSGCGSSDVNENNLATELADSDFFRTVIDVAGNELVIKEKPVRIVSVVPAATEILYDLGLEARIVGVTENCDYPGQALQKEKVGDWNINVEKLVSLEPDLVVGMVSANAGLLDDIAKLGINTLAIEAQSFGEIYEAYEMVSMATGTEDRANDIIADMKERVAAVQEKVTTIANEEKVKVFFEIGWEPLYSVGPGSLQHEILVLAGGINVVDIDKSWVEYSNEKLIEMDPDLILIGTHPWYTAEDAKQRVGWSQLTAVKEERLIDTIDSNTLVRPTYRAVQGLEEVAKALYPDLF